MAGAKFQKIDPFNPLDKKSLGESVAGAMLSQSAEVLPPAKTFTGAGVYAIYYRGDFPCYERIAKQNRDGDPCCPIYVGKAVPAGARKGGFGLGADPGQVLHRRLCEHASSIELAENLHLGDFLCRFLVVDDIWIPLTESLLIEMFKPLWNLRIDGFGNHDPGSGRYGQKRSPWDTLHPGRPWASRLAPPAVNGEALRESIDEYIARPDC